MARDKVFSLCIIFSCLATKRLLFTILHARRFVLLLVLVGAFVAKNLLRGFACLALGALGRRITGRRLLIWLEQLA